MEIERREHGKSIQGMPLFLFSLVILLCPVFIFKLFYSLPLTESLLWYFGVFVCFYIPGSLLIRLVGVRTDEYFLRIFYSVALGTALMPLLYTFLRRLSLPELLYPFAAVMVLLWTILLVRDIRKKGSSLYPEPADIGALVILISVIFLFLHPSYFTDVVYLKDGFKMRIAGPSENSFHLGIINELKNTFPPRFIYANGFSFAQYHINMHLEMEMFHRLFSLDTIKLTYFYFPLLYICLLVFLPYLYIRTYWNRRLIGILAGIVLLGSDLSFIPGLLGMTPEDFPWVFVFHSTIWSVLSLNGFLPSLFILFLCLIYLKEFSLGASVKHLLLFALLAYSAYGFKSSMGIHILGAAFLTGIASLFLTGDRRSGIYLCTATVLTTAAIGIDVFLFREGMGRTLSIEPFNFFNRSLTNLGISHIAWYFYPFAILAYLLSTFSIRLVGLSLLKNLFQKKNFDVILFFLMTFILSGFFLSEFVTVHPATPLMDDAGWFATQALMAAWIPLTYVLMRIRRSGKTFWSLAVITVLLSAPGSVQFLSSRSDPHYYTLDDQALEIVHRLESTPPDSVILHPLNFNNPSLASNFAGRPSVINMFRTFASVKIGQSEFQKRYLDVHMFFYQYNKTSRSSGFRSAILNKYSVDYVYAPLSYAQFLGDEPLLREVFRNDAYVLYGASRF